jgi:hypothetical protein
MSRAWPILNNSIGTGLTSRAGQLAANLGVELVKREKGRPEVRATFRNFGTQEIRYTLVREKGRWLIDDARSILGET